MIKIIDLYAEWCGPCKVIAPIVEKVGQELGIEVETVNVDHDAMATVSKYNIKSVPVVIIEKDGIEVDRITGVASRFEEVLKEKIEAATK